MNAMAEAQKLSGNFKGSWLPASQGDILKVAASTGMSEAKRAGVCWEVCRRWVSACLTGQLTESTIYDILSPSVPGTSFGKFDKDAFRELIEAHAARNQGGVAENYRIDGLKNHKTLYRTYGCFGGAGGLKSRKAVLDVISKTPGAYIFSFIATTGSGGGHAVAFDTRPGGAKRFMDPNSGEGTFPDMDALKAFFDAYYGALYKSDYTGGERELTRYSLG
ncbi:YopT-type cysteine protease domain-containing protein [Mangrovicoccus sp. HB161399]|uniref:YopT-type cysteine protease domain-containing protein n=1 Tax=Mangrovicoccus sp. HB161399 TaxID=2720392 RepID=UPI001556A288|nr:YopT-type cysteine protease domain-containing protein [Mangrovicoccus sp. HB161399]